MGAKNLRQTVTIRASPRAVYETLVDPKKHAKFSGRPAKLDRKAGGRFSHYGGDLGGFVLAVEPSKKIVLAWRSNSWAAGRYSIAQFTFTKAGQGTKLVFEQFGIPESDFADIRSGWKLYYWAPLKKYLEE